MNRVLYDGVNESVVAELERILDSECKNVLVTGNGEKTSAVLEYVRRNPDKYDCVFYAQYDKEKHLDTSLSIDCVLKKCLTRPLIKQLQNCKNYLVEFESRLRENTLVVVDNYNIPSLSPYMRHLASSKAKLVVVSECDMKTLPDSFVKVCAENDSFLLNTDALSQEQKEFLMTLCAMLFYLGDCTQISSSNSGVFDRHSVNFYLGSLSSHFDALKDMGFVQEEADGRIGIDKKVMHHVMTNLEPTAQNCKTFMSFLERYTDFYVIQDTKDLLAKFYTSRDGDFAIVGTPELFDVYTRFCLTDENSGLRLYNMFMALILQRINDGKREHQLMRNTGFLLNKLCTELKGSLAEAIYDDELYLDDFCPECYSSGIKANLDIIRICVSLLRGITSDLYQENLSILSTLYNAMDDLYSEIEACEADASDKCLMLDDCIRICHETFAYFSVFDSDGSYDRERDDVNMSYVHYSYQKHSDRKMAESLAFGYSELTVSLYGLFQKYISKWLELNSENDDTIDNRLLDAMHREKMEYRKELFESISVHYCRIKDGLENFSDFFDRKKKNVCVWKETLGEEFAKRLESNRHLTLRGFDGGTKTGAERYAEKVVSEIRKSRNPRMLFKIVLSKDYPVTDEFYKCLLSKKFVRLIAENMDMPDRVKANLLLFLVCNYNENCQSLWKNRLFREVIASLYASVSRTETFLERMYSCTSSMYLVNKTHNLSETDTFSDILYEKVIKNYNGSNDLGHEYLAKALYDYLKHSKKPRNKKKLENAFDAAFFEYYTKDRIIDLDGFCKISQMLLGSDNNINNLIEKYKERK